MMDPIKHITLDESTIQSIITDRKLAFTWIDLIPDSRYPLFEPTMLYLFDLLRKVLPLRILDTGSGLTSVLLRKHYPNTTIITVDNNKDWLEKTGELGRRLNVNRHGYHMWDDFLLIDEIPFDFIIHDLGDMKTRLDTLDTVLRYAAPKCHMFLDNFGIPKYKEYAMNRMNSLGFTPVFPPSPMRLDVSNAGGFAAFVRKQ